MAEASKHKKNIYLRDAELWDALAKIAAKEDRSINYIVERAVKVEVALRTDNGTPLFISPSDLKKLKKK